MAYGMTDPKAAAAINALAAQNNAAAAASPYTSKTAVSAGPSAYGMNNTNAAAIINNRALTNNVNATSSGGYGMNNVAAGNYINSLANSSASRSTGGSSNPSWNPISGVASYQLPSTFNWDSLGSFFGLDNQNTPFVKADGSITGKYGSMPGSGFGSGQVPWDGSGGSAAVGGGGVASGGGALGGGGLGGAGGALSGLTGMLGGAGGLGSLFGGGAAGGGSAPGGGYQTGDPGGGSQQPAEPQYVPLPEKPPDPIYAGAYTPEQLEAQRTAASDAFQQSVKLQQDIQNVAAMDEILKKQKLQDAEYEKALDEYRAQYKAQANGEAAASTGSGVGDESASEGAGGGTAAPADYVPTDDKGRPMERNKQGFWSEVWDSSDDVIDERAGKSGSSGNAAAGGGGLWGAFQQIADQFNGRKGNSAAAPTNATGSAGQGAEQPAKASAYQTGSGAPAVSGSGSGAGTGADQNEDNDRRSRRRSPGGLGMGILF